MATIRRQLDVVSDRKLAANRANAAKSTGPRSAKGKKRVGGNAKTHGLFSKPDRAATFEEIEALARELACGRTEDIILEKARNAAEAEIDLRRVRRAKLALIERASEFGSLTPPRFFSTSLQEVRWLIAMDGWFERRHGGRRPKQPTPEDFLSTMPSNPQERTLEAIMRVMPELAKLEQYEKRAAARRDHAIRRIIER